MLLSSDCVPLNEKRICHLVKSAEVGNPAKVSASARSLALSFFVGGDSAEAYFRAVFRSMPSFRAIAQRESPCFFSHDLGSLGDGKLVFQNAVEHLDPGLFLLIQLYIPHRDDIVADQLAGDRIVDHRHK